MHGIGPAQLIPHGGEGWLREQKPGPIPARYNHTFGTVYYFLSLNVFHQRLQGRVHRTKDARNWLHRLPRVRRKYTLDQPVDLIWDGASNHWTPEIRAWAVAKHVRRVSMPTHASHLNPVECHAGDLQKLALTGGQFTTPQEVARALDRAVTYRNR